MLAHSERNYCRVKKLGYKSAIQKHKVEILTKYYYMHDDGSVDATETTTIASLSVSASGSGATKVLDSLTMQKEPIGEDENSKKLKEKN